MTGGGRLYAGAEDHGPPDPRPGREMEDQDMHHKNSGLLQTAVLMMGVLLVATAARADFEGAYANASTWYFEISHVPDLDQKRTALPNDGRNHCVPTSAINWMAYFANHGLPSLPPGDGNWQLQALYDDASDAILAMGSVMGTDPNEGTYASGASFGYWIWLLGRPIVTTSYRSNWVTSPTLQQIGQSVFQGAYVQIIVGWYIEDPPGFITRDGGHALSLNEAARSGDAMQLGWRDPSSDEGDWTWQSPFTTETYEVENRLVLPSGGLFPRPMGKVVGYGSGWIDGYTAIRPLFTLTSQPDFPILVLKNAFVLDGSAVPIQVVYESLDCNQIVDMMIRLDNLSYGCIINPAIGEPNQLWIVDALTGEHRVVDNASLNDPCCVDEGRYGDLYVMDGNDLVKINPDVDPPDVLRITPDGEIGAICYDDANDEIMLLATDTRRLLRYPHDLESDPESLIIPDEVPLTGRTSLCYNRALECSMFVSDESDSLWQLTQVVGNPWLIVEEVVLPGIVEPKAVQAGDDGRVYMSCQQQVVEVEYSSKREGWTLVDEPYFDDLTVSDLLIVARSRSNHDPEIHDTEPWRNVLPGYCLPNGLCRSYIARVLLGDIDQSSGCDTDSGYADYTDQSTELAIGEPLEMIVQGSISLPADTCGIWIDWDRDLSFDDPRDVVAIGPFDLETETFQTTVIPPIDAQPGATTMRVRVAESTAMDPCNDEWLSGESEDYTVVILDPCPADFDDDGDVDTADLLHLLGAWGTPDGDVDGDGDTDTADLLALLGTWGECP
jgi:hypothetical protein